MNELDFLSKLAELAHNDNADFDVYATQFTKSLVNLPANEDPPPYWHGRLIGAVEEKDKSIRGYRIEFLGKSYEEIEFRRKLKSNEILILLFKIIEDPVYKPDRSEATNAKDPHYASYRAQLVARVDGEVIEREVTVRHRIRKTFLAYQTEIN